MVVAVPLSATRSHIVGEVTVVTTKDHSWIIIENTSTQPIILGVFVLPPGEEVTISSRYIIGVHRGIWYNVEPHFHYHEGFYQNRLSLTRLITDEDIELIKEFLADNNYWNLTQNCTSFAANLWNRISKDKKLDAGRPNLPSKLFKSIERIEGAKMDIPLTRKYPIGYYSLEGAFIEISYEETNFVTKEDFIRIIAPRLLALLGVIE